MSSERVTPIEIPVPVAQATWARQIAKGRITPGAPDECWIWRGKVQKGYGRTPLIGPGAPRKAAGSVKAGRVHRIAYTALVGPIPAGMTLDHLCRERLCCNPAHLEPVTTRENVLRGDTIPAANVAKQSCLRGHWLRDPNLVPAALMRGSRECRCCAAGRDFAKRRNRPGEERLIALWADYRYADMTLAGAFAHTPTTRTNPPSNSHAPSVDRTSTERGAR